jgi:YbbR domain-containing protein
MKEKLLDNLSLKLLSIVCAIVLWMIIVNVYDPSTSVTVSGVNVELINTEALTSKDYSYEVVDGSKISVYISGPRSVVTDIKSSDIIATADLSNVTVFSDYVDINVRVNREGSAAANLEVAPRTTAIRLKIENRVTKTYNIETQLVGSPADGYVVGSRQISPATLNVTGTVSALDEVVGARVQYDVSGSTMDIADSAAIVLYDQEGNDIDNEKLEMSKTSVDIRIGINSTKTVPIKYTTKGSPASGYGVQSIDYSISEVTVAGTADKLREITEIEVPDTVLDLTGLEADKTFYVNLLPYLPDGVTIPSSGVASVTVHVYSDSEKEISIPVTAITVNGLASDKVISYGSLTEVKVTVAGEASVISALNAINISPSIRLDSLGAGEVDVPVSCVLPQNCTLKGTATVRLSIYDVEDNG